MGTHLAAVNSVFSAHALFNKRMTRLRLHSLTTALRNDINSVPRQARVMDNFSPRIFA